MFIKLHLCEKWQDEFGPRPTPQVFKWGLQAGSGTMPGTTQHNENEPQERNKAGSRRSWQLVAHFVCNGLLQR